MFLPRRYCRFAAVLLGLVVGCAAAKPNLKTPQPEQFTPPPDDDPRFSKPFEYPKDLLNKPPVKPSTPGMPGVGGKGPSGGMGGGGGGMP
ncbi:MAG: hypothetical protein ACJ8C4_05940 [Gemmataceae bacterium]